ncbi:hypothetical protein HH308_14390 [Gordonia sp. TBRC 11910]|uniref:Uncharacterized protein n=1 Tax=Gordonia asplenii TaxID=2725283 RepID=A0A848KU14_9ACTN|nr:hypothetical protein [Gordonia asplenii]NMO02404.1 hypothetical protein [Gordonia asplenii]
MTAPVVLVAATDTAVTGSADLAAQATDIDSRITAFGDLAPIAASVGAGFPDTAAIRRAVSFLVDADIGRILTDLDAVVAAHQSFQNAEDAMAQRSLASSWQGRSADAALAAVDVHSRASSWRLPTLTAIAATAAPALSGLKTVLHNVFGAIDAVCDPILAGTPVATVPSALAGGTLRPNVVADEIAARVRLFDQATSLGRTALHDILAEFVGVDAHTSTGDLALAGEQ